MSQILINMYSFIKSMAKMGKILNISGEKFSGKTHLVNILLKNLKVLN